MVELPEFVAERMRHAVAEALSEAGLSDPSMSPQEVARVAVETAVGALLDTCDVYEECRFLEEAEQSAPHRRDHPWAPIADERRLAIYTPAEPGTGFTCLGYEPHEGWFTVERTHPYDGRRRPYVAAQPR